jgi:hypothetical protein
VDDVAEAGRGDSALVNQCVQKSNRLAEFLPEARDECCPQRGDSACTADDRVGAFAANLVTGSRIGIASDIGNAAAATGAGGLCRHSHSGLIRRKREELADSASGTLADGLAGGGICNNGIPHGLAGDSAA